MLPDAAVQHYEEQSTLSEDVARLVAALWATVTVGDINAGWEKIRERVFVGISVAQLQAALSAESYLAAVLAETGQVAPPAARVNARAFAGVASDGRSLETLVEEPRIATLTRIAQGAAPQQALDTGLVRLVRVAVTQTQDAGREAVGVGVVARPGLFGYIRMVSPPCCKRCAILAGKWFGWNDGFLRHPGCDCRHIPVAENAPDDIGTDQGVLFGSGQVRGLNQADRQAIEDGADPSAVVNASRPIKNRDGTYTSQVSADGMTTTEGTTRRGYASYVKREIARQRGETADEVRVATGGRGRRAFENRVQGRLTPAAIYKNAANREEALGLLKANGYIVGDIKAVARQSRSSVPPQLRDRFSTT